MIKEYGAKCANPTVEHPGFPCEHPYPSLTAAERRARFNEDQAILAVAQTAFHQDGLTGLAPLDGLEVSAHRVYDGPWIHVSVADGPDASVEAGDRNVFMVIMGQHGVATVTDSDGTSYNVGVPAAWLFESVYDL